MIPELGFLIACYVVFRGFEALMRPADWYITKPARVLVSIAAVILMLVALFCVIDFAVRSGS